MSRPSGSSKVPRLILTGAASLALLLAAFLVIGPADSAARGSEPTFQSIAVQDKDILRVSLTLTNADDEKLIGTLRTELIDSDNNILSVKEQEVVQAEKTGTYKIELDTKKKPTDKLRIRHALGMARSEVPVSKQLLLKGHETTLSAGGELHSGTTAAIRCSVHGVKSLTETVPLPNATIEVRLEGKDGKAHQLYKGKADDKGVSSPRLTVPALPSGDYKMVVVTRSALGEEKLEQNVKVKGEPKVLLVTDKPLYQPGQLMHIRALCLGGFDLKPVADAMLVFEVEDSKGNKVFKKEQTTTKHGVAHVDFQLASEVNQGDYRIRAVLGEKTADKTVVVKPYVLPKFKSDLTADRKFYLPKETIKADLQVDYFFGKPVAGGKYKITASTFDVAFKDFQTFEGKTDAQGHAKFDIKLPDYFVGQPLSKGNAIVKVEAKITDTADHTETITRTYAVSDQPIKVSLMPESGRLIPGVENRIFAAALSPDGSPVACEIQLWHVKDIKDKLIGKARTGANGLTEFRFTPDPKHFRGDAGWHQHDIEMLGGKQQVWGAKHFLDVKVVATPEKAAKVESQIALTSDLLGGNVLLRLDKGIYKGGDTMNLDIRSSAGTPTVYLDLIKEGQSLLTTWLDVKDGKAAHKLDLPAEVFGTIEVHAYQMLASGEILRDSRVVYIQPANELKVNVKADKDTFKPGEEGTIRFVVTDKNDKPTAAALGVIIVDEAVYALQEMQPGLEKVYFTLQQELLKPQAQVNYKPNESIDALVMQPRLDAERQQVAQALMCAVQPKPPAGWVVDPNIGRKQRFEATAAQVGWMLFHEGANLKDVLTYDARAKKVVFTKDILAYFFQRQFLDASLKTDPLGRTLTLEALVEIDKDFTAENLARALTAYRMSHVSAWFAQNMEQQRAKLFKDKKWNLPADALETAAKAHNWMDGWSKDGWGKNFKLVKRDAKHKNIHGGDIFADHMLVSAGPDGKFGTDDDYVHGDETNWKHDGRFQFARDNLDGRLGMLMDQGIDHRWRGRWDGIRAMPEGKGGFGGPFPPAMAGGFPQRDFAKEAGKVDKTAESKPTSGKPTDAAGGPAPVRMREYFPETMLWRPSLITDDKGIAVLNVPFADSITTWRLTASASSSAGLLGGTTAPLRVFQDFFVDLDLPIALTKNDEVSFPVAVYNYLKEPQTVKLQLVEDPWFELVDGKAERSLEVKPGEVTAIKYRIRAKKLGHQPLTVKAHGSKMSDAIKRVIEVLPDGQMKENVVNNQLAGKSKHTLMIPDNAIPDASKMFVKIYPGVFSQVLEGVDGLIRLPGG